LQTACKANYVGLAGVRGAGRIGWADGGLTSFRATSLEMQNQCRKRRTHPAGSEVCPGPVPVPLSVLQQLIVLGQGSGVLFSMCECRGGVAVYYVLHASQLQAQ